MVKFLFCLKMPTLRTVESRFWGDFLVFQNLTMVKFWNCTAILRSKISLRSNFTRHRRISFGVAEFHCVNDRGLPQRNAVLRSAPSTDQLCATRSKTEQDASSSRRVRIRRRERTFPYMTKTKRKLEEEIRSGFSVLH